MKLTLGRKLGLGFGIILALMVLSVALTYSKASAIKETQAMITEVCVPTIGALKGLQGELNQTQSKGRQAILAGSDAALWPGIFGKAILRAGRRAFARHSHDAQRRAKPPLGPAGGLEGKGSGLHAAFAGGPRD